MRPCAADPCHSLPSDVAVSASSQRVDGVDGPPITDRAQNATTGRRHDAKAPANRRFIRVGARRGSSPGAEVAAFGAHGRGGFLGGLSVEDQAAMAPAPQHGRAGGRFFASLRGYEGLWLRFDVVAGLTLWAILVPQALAYAS